MGTSDLFTFRFLKNLKSHISMSQKIIALNIWKDIYMRSIRKKVPFKNTLYFGKYKKDKFLTKRYTIFYYFNTIYNQKFVFLYLSKYNMFLIELFCIHFFCMYISIYVFNAIIFENIEM
jgi:hypothetical protein